MSVSALTVKPVIGKAGLRPFLDVPFAIYKDDPSWVAPLFLERHDHLNPKKNPYFEHADAQLFVAWRNGKPVGRISAQHCRLRAERFNDGVGQFGMFESVDDQQVAQVLFATAAAWLAERGFTAMQGPYSFSINDELGLLVDGFDTPPNMMMAHSPRYYGAMFEQAGFTKAKDVIAYVSHDATALPPFLQKILKRTEDHKDIVVRPIRKKNIVSEINLIMDIFNDAWSENWGFVPFTKAELDKFAKDLKMLVAEECVSIAEYRGEAAAFAVTLPNLNEWIRGFNGRLLPFNWVSLVKKVLSGRSGSMRMPLMGVRKKFQDGLLGSMLAVSAINAVRQYHINMGCHECEMSWILEDNVRIRHMIEAFGGKPYKTYRIYEKPL